MSRPHPLSPVLPSCPRHRCLTAHVLAGRRKEDHASSSNSKLEDSFHHRKRSVTVDTRATGHLRRGASWVKSYSRQFRWVMRSIDPDQSGSLCRKEIR